MARRERKNDKKRVSNMTEEQRQRERERKRTSHMPPERIIKERERKRVSSMTEDQIEKQRARKRNRKASRNAHVSEDSNGLDSGAIGSHLLPTSMA